MCIRDSHMGHLGSGRRCRKGSAACIGEKVQHPHRAPGKPDLFRKPIPVYRLLRKKPRMLKTKGLQLEGQISIPDGPLLRKTGKFPFASAFAAPVIITIPLFPARMPLLRAPNHLGIRPDPQVIWSTEKRHPGWKKWNGYYHRSSKGGGEWEFSRLPEQWSIRYGDLTFQLKPFSFKHTGLFPEQAVNWDWFSEKIRLAGRPVRVLNLFAYTGGATLAAAAAGAQVTHVAVSYTHLAAETFHNGLVNRSALIF